jgi:hypothetical protein
MLLNKNGVNKMEKTQSNLKAVLKTLIKTKDLLCKAIIINCNSLISVERIELVLEEVEKQIKEIKTFITKKSK